MLQLQSSPDDANIVNTNDQKTIAAITTVPVVANQESNNIIAQEQQLGKTQQSRLDKAIDRLSSRRTIFQIVSTIPTFAVQLHYAIEYANQCPIQPLINVFLIVHGCLSLATGIVLSIGFITANYIKRSLNPSPHARHVIRGSGIGELILLLLMVAWLIVGQVWVFGAQTHGFQSTNSTLTATYCHPTVFYTGFAIIIVTYGIWLIIILVLVGKCIIKRHKTKRETIPKLNERNGGQISDVNRNF